MSDPLRHGEGYSGNTGNRVAQYARAPDTEGSAPACEAGRAGDVPQDATLDAFLGGRLHLFQPQKGYRAGSDAMLLAAVLPVSANPGQRLLDCGSGVGAVGLAAAARCPSLRAVLLERESELVEFAKRNIAENGLGDRALAVQMDLTAPGDVRTSTGLDDNSFDIVAANPPYYVRGHRTASPSKLKSAGHEMTVDELDLWVRFMARMAKSGGTLVMIHAAEALGDVLHALSGRFGGVQILPIFPRQGSTANRILVAATKGSRRPLRMLNGLILHGPGHEYTEQIDAVFRHGAKLEVFSHDGGKLE